MEINEQILIDFFENWKSGMGDERIFISENDLVLSFALYILERFPDAKVNFELPFDIEYKFQTKDENFHNPGNSYLDLHVFLNGIRYGFEFKYHTCKYAVNTNLYKFELKDHIARDVLRFNFRKDIHRLEHLRNNYSEFRIHKGFAVLLTNDKALIKTDANKNTLDKEYRFSEIAPIRGGDVKWSKVSGKGNWVGSDQFDIMLPLKKEGYEIYWRDYHQIKDPKKDFKFCVIEI